MTDYKTEAWDAFEEAMEPRIGWLDVAGLVVVLGLIVCIYSAAAR